jgi:uncharacterized protein YbcV (DUF1398 family)
MERVMDAAVRNVLRECTRGSDEERMTFGDVVGRLMQAGVERYHADLVRAEKTYYMPDGESEVVAAAPVGIAPAQTFSAAGVDAAVRAIQAGTIGYKTFCERVMQAGCVGYDVSLVGRSAVYRGRTGEAHVEPFPGAA